MPNQRDARDRLSASTMERYDNPHPVDSAWTQLATKTQAAAPEGRAGHPNRGRLWPGTRLDLRGDGEAGDL